VTRPILIAGPTASGKSGLALALAEQLGGAVINADALQVYANWRALTARPSAAEEARAPHRLYGHLPATAPYSVGDWLREVAAVLEACRAESLRPIIVGGTGLNFRALTQGLAEIPPVPPEVRARTEVDFEALGRDGFAARLAEADPETFAAIDPKNPARLRRAWEVLAATGEGMAAWRARTPAPLVPLADAVAVLLIPDRAALYARCDARFDQMLAEGALEEARAAMDLPPDAPALKALGAAELIAHLRGEITLEAAAERAKTATRNYAKRQLTWFRNQMAGWPAFATAETARAYVLGKLAA
jgi:tRNA dimethylallyltransferase